MEKFLEKLFSYIEKVLSPYQLWLVILVVTSSLLFSPENIREDLGLLEISKVYKAYISLIFLVSVTVFVLKGVLFLYNLLINYRAIDTKNLTKKETAILYCLLNYPHQEYLLNNEHHTVRSLEHRNLIQVFYNHIQPRPHNSCKISLNAHRRVRKAIDRLNIDRDEALSFTTEVCASEISLYES